MEHAARVPMIDPTHASRVRHEAASPRQHRSPMSKRLHVSSTVVILLVAIVSIARADAPRVLPQGKVPEMDNTGQQTNAITAWLREHGELID